LYQAAQFAQAQCGEVTTMRLDVIGDRCWSDVPSFQAKSAQRADARGGVAKRRCNTGGELPGGAVFGFPNPRGDVLRITSRTGDEHYICSSVPKLWGAAMSTSMNVNKPMSLQDRTIGLAEDWTGPLNSGAANICPRHLITRSLVMVFIMVLWNADAHAFQICAEGKGCRDFDVTVGAPPKVQPPPTAMPLPDGPANDLCRHLSPDQRKKIASCGG
jgi:hypothetical protein